MSDDQEQGKVTPIGTTSIGEVEATEVATITTAMQMTRHVSATASLSAGLSIARPALLSREYERLVGELEAHIEAQGLVPLEPTTATVTIEVTAYCREPQE